MTRSRAPELLADLADHAAAAARQSLGAADAAAAAFGQQLARSMASHWGGQLIYFPMGRTQQLDERDERIWREFRGNNHAELARRHGVGVQRIYKIIKAQQAAQFERSQRSLLD